MNQNFPQSAASDRDSSLTATERASENFSFSAQLSGLRQEAVRSLSSDPGIDKTKPTGQIIVEKYDILRPVTLDDPKPVTAGSLNLRFDIVALEKMGLIIDKTLPAPETRAARLANLASHLMEGKASIINENANVILVRSNGADPKINPDFLVKKDGTIEMHNQAGRPPYIVEMESTNDREVQPTRRTTTIQDGLPLPQAERVNQIEPGVQIAGDPRAGEDAPKKENSNNSGNNTTVEQNTAAKELDNWIHNHQQMEDLATKSVSLAASQLAARLNDIENQFCHSGSMSQQEASDYFSEKSSRCKKDNDYSAILDMLAYMSNPDSDRPYDTIKAGGNSGFAVGRYGLTADIAMDWLSSSPDFDRVMGSPADLRKLPDLMARLAHAGKVPKDYAAEFKDPNFVQGFLQCLDEMRSGDENYKPTVQELQKYLPADTQEAIMRGIAENAAKHNTNAALLALSMLKGEPLSRLTDAEVKDPSSQNYMFAALKVLGFALARHEAGPRDRIRWRDESEDKHQNAQHHNKSNKGLTGPELDTVGTGKSSNLAFSIARAAEHNAKATDTIGWCLRSVAHTLDHFGIHLYGGSAYEAAPQLAKNSHFKEVSTAHLKKGTVLVFGPSHGHPYGHITVYLGNGMEASDHVQGLVNFNKYSSVRAFEPTK